jgi:hypothetical protein
MMSKMKITGKAEAPVAAGGEGDRTVATVSITAVRHGNTRKSRLLMFGVAVIKVWALAPTPIYTFFRT